MEYEPGCERYRFRETWRERHGLTWNNFLNNWGFAIGPFLFATAAAVLAYGVSKADASDLPPREAHAMLASCNKLEGASDRQLCADIVNDQSVSANYKRSCFEAATLLLKGTTWSVIKSSAPALTCRSGLSHAGYPVTQMLARLARH